MLLFAIVITSFLTWCFAASWDDVNQRGAMYDNPTEVKIGMFLIYVACLTCVWLGYFLKRGGPWFDL